jgi:transcriptional regulator with XRE-family HTH domain
MDIPTKIKLSETYAKMSEAELARKLGTTSQSFEQRMKTGKFSYTDLCTIADALGAEFVCCFKSPPTGRKYNDLIFNSNFNFKA